MLFFSRYCGKVFNQTSNLREHEALHQREKHVVTTDPNRRLAQTFAKNRGRPSILEIDRQKTAQTAKVVATVVDEEDEQATADDPEEMAQNENEMVQDANVIDGGGMVKIAVVEATTDGNVMEAGK